MTTATTAKAPRSGDQATNRLLMQPPSPDDHDAPWTLSDVDRFRRVEGLFAALQRATSATWCGRYRAGTIFRRTAATPSNLSFDGGACERPSPVRHSPMTQPGGHYDARHERLGVLLLCFADLRAALRAHRALEAELRSNDDDVLDS